MQHAHHQGTHHGTLPAHGAHHGGHGAPHGGASHPGSGGGLHLVRGHGGQVVAVRDGCACSPEQAAAHRPVPPALTVVHPGHPHPLHHPGYWIWHKASGPHAGWHFIIPEHAGVRGRAPRIPRKVLPTNWPQMVEAKPHPALRPPPPPPHDLQTRVHAVPAVADPAHQAMLAAQKYARHVDVGMHLASSHWVPGHWVVSNGAWLYRELHLGVTSGTQEGETSYDVLHAPMSAFGPRPPQVQMRDFWPDQHGAMRNYWGQSPSNAPAKIDIPARVKHARHLLKARLEKSMSRVDRQAAALLTGKKH
jgi:hypothetical protein